MRIKRSQITNFTKKNLKKIIKLDIDNFNQLKEGDLLSLFKFVSMLATEKVDIFVTLCPLLLTNSKMLEKIQELK